MGTLSQIEELLLRWEELRAEGDPDPLSRVCADCPELADELVKRIRALETMDLLMDVDDDPAPTWPSGGAPGPDSRDEAASFEAVAHYRPLRLHARGGLGEVLIAHDERLAREVALKRLQEAREGHPESRQRFLVEAEVTGRLEHPGIVPVYGLGADDRGRPFYTM